nr:MAG TPA: hypothetical protein [Caudoviricetes sp.]
MFSILYSTLCKYISFYGEISQKNKTVFFVFIQLIVVDNKQFT